MSPDFNDPELVRRAKELAAGPLGDMMSKFPLRFAAGVFIGPTRRSLPIRPNNGTATLLRLKGRPLAVTCSHVIQNFRERSVTNQPGFWIGSLQVDPLERVITEDTRLDVAVLDLSGLNLSLISDHEIGSSFLDPAEWPPQSPDAGDFISFGGFPGVWREHRQDDEVVFRSFSLGASEVTAVGDDYIVCQMNREYWVSSRGLRGHDLHDFGGMSGGPALIWRGIRADLVGFIYEYSESLDLLYIRSAHVLAADGSLAL